MNVYGYGYGQEVDEDEVFGIQKWRKRGPVMRMQQQKTRTKDDVE
jgi:hypothetical protein